MRMTRAWAMPSAWTFTIKPIAKLLQEYVGDGKGWIDPFAGKSKLAEYRNDINPKWGQPFQLEAIEFLTKNIRIKNLNGGLYDPPYSLRQIMECYEKAGKAMFDKKWATTKFYTDTKNALADKIKPGGVCISFGWNSIGMGKKRGFEIEEILLVSHGRLHNDTIVTVERKIQSKLL